MKLNYLSELIDRVEVEIGYLIMVWSVCDG
jgi:hypothetical protein